MANLGSLFIGGTEENSNGFRCGISYSLSKKPPIPFVYITQGGYWQGEFTPQSTDVVARTTQLVSHDALHSTGFSAIQEALDVLSVKGITSAILSNPSDENVGVYYEDGKLVLSVYNLSDWPSKTHMKGG